MKVSYRTCPNMKQAISGHNSKVLKENNPKTETQAKIKSCNCQKKAECPLQNKCLHDDGVVYQATVTQENGKIDTYVGSTKDFKERHRNHKKSFKLAAYKTETELSVFLWKLKSENIIYSLKWKVIDKGKIFNPVTKICSLCTKEKYHLIHQPELGTSNERDELGAHCRHGKGFLLSSLK